MDNFFALSNDLRGDPLVHKPPGKGADAAPGQGLARRHAFACWPCASSGGAYGPRESGKRFAIENRVNVSPKEKGIQEVGFSAPLPPTPILGKVSKRHRSKAFVCSSEHPARQQGRCRTLPKVKASAEAASRAVLAQGTRQSLASKAVSLKVFC